MARIAVPVDDIEPDHPPLVEGFPGVGLIGEIAVDQLISTFEMTHYANVHCTSIPSTATYQRDNGRRMPPIRLSVDADLARTPESHGHRPESDYRVRRLRLVFLNP